MYYPPCHFGLKCPYFRISEDGDDICIFPYLIPNEYATYANTDECDCGLMDFDSELCDILSAYNESPAIQTAIRKEKERMNREAEKILTDIKNHERLKKDNERTDDK